MGFRFVSIIVLDRPTVVGQDAHAEGDIMNEAIIEGFFHKRITCPVYHHIV